MAEIINMEYARKKLEDAQSNVSPFGTVKKFGDITVTLRRSNPFHTDGYDIDEEDLEEFYAWKKAGSIPCYEIAASKDGAEAVYNFRDFVLNSRHIEKTILGKTYTDDILSKYKDYKKVIDDSTVKITFDRLNEENINKLFRRIDANGSFHYKLDLLNLMDEVMDYVVETIEKIKDPVENYVHEYFENLDKARREKEEQK